MMTMLYSIWGLRKLILIVENWIFNLLYHTRLRSRVSIFGFPIISIAKSSQISIGHGLVLISHSFFSGPGVNHPVIIRTMKPGARLSIGDNVGISGGSICVADEVVIGSNVMLGANSIIADNDFHSIKPEGRRFNEGDVGSGKIIIGDNVFLGMNAIVLKGVKIGKNSVIGAGSIVTKDLPANCVAVGIPAKIIGYIS